MSSTAPAPLYAVYRLYQYLSVVNSSSLAIRCFQTVSVSICRQQLQLSYTLYVDCICIYLSSTAPAPLYAVYRLYQYLAVVNNSSSATCCLQTVLVFICRQQLQLIYTLFIDCISICRQQVQLIYTLLIDSISIYLSSTAPAQVHVVYRLYQYLSVVKSSSSSIRCLQTVSVPICRQQLQLLYTLYVDCISIFLSSRAPAPLHARCRLYYYRQQLQLRYTLYVDCIRIYLSSTAPAPLYAVYRLYQYLSVVNSSISSTRCLQTVSVSISRVTHTQLRYTLYVDCISISFVVLYRPSSGTRCMQTSSVLLCFIGPAPLHAV